MEVPDLYLELPDWDDRQEPEAVSGGGVGAGVTRRKRGLVAQRTAEAEVWAMDWTGPEGIWRALGRRCGESHGWLSHMGREIRGWPDIGLCACLGKMWLCLVFVVDGVYLALDLKNET